MFVPGTEGCGGHLALLPPALGGLQGGLLGSWAQSPSPALRCLQPEHSRVSVPVVAPTWGQGSSLSLETLEGGVSAHAGPGAAPQ